MPNGQRMQYEEEQQDVDVRLSADDIRDRLKTLKSRCISNEVRACVMQKKIPKNKRF